MKVIDFPERLEFVKNAITIGENQPEFIPIPALCFTTPNPGIVEYMFKFELSDVELEQIKQTKTFWCSQIGNIFHPINVSVGNMARFIGIQYRKNSDGLYTVWIPTEKELTEIKDLALEDIIPTICAQVANAKPENLVFIEKPGLQLGADKILRVV